MKILFVNPSGSFSVYNKSSIRAVVPVLPAMSLSMLSASLLKNGHEVRILDLALFNNPSEQLSNSLIEFSPDMLAVTATTPLFNELVEITKAVKATDSSIITIAGGPHVSALPEDSLMNESIDIVAVGEGEDTINCIASASELDQVKGIYYKKSGSVIKTQAQDAYKDLDDLPLPYFESSYISKYKFSKVISRAFPVAPMELSRGCPFNCVFCNKNIMGRRFRIKSADRVIEELEYYKKLGFREIHVIDDQFTSNMNHAKAVLEKILSKGLDFYWNFRTGVRVDCIDQEFLSLAKRIGCYQIGVGFESGNQEVLNSVQKGITIPRAYRAASLIKKSGIECAGFFMLGFINDTERTMDDTIEYAKKLDIDYAKATIVTPFPGTELFRQYKEMKLIKSYDWSKYNFHSVNEVYDHPHLSWNVLNHYYKLFHRKFYLRPKYLYNRLVKGILTGRLFIDIYYGLKTFTGL